jgi:RNA polymerase sigma-70 factor (ECF subfamily)
VVAIARNCAIDYLRVQGRWSQNTMNENEHAALFADFSDGAASFDTVRQVKRAMDGLSASQRQAIEMAYFEGMSQTEIATRMGQPLGTVKTWMRRAMQQMRESLGVEG